MILWIIICEYQGLSSLDESYETFLIWMVDRAMRYLGFQQRNVGGDHGESGFGLPESEDQKIAASLHSTAPTGECVPASDQAGR
jgi:hypothetical protein